MMRIAIVGAGIAGLGCADALHAHAEVHIFERNRYIGGHTNTITVDEDGKPVPIDTGFMVFTPKTYPNLTALFQRFDVPVKPTDMSFSVHHGPTGLEWNGAGFNALFGQRRNLVNPRFLKLVYALYRFSQQSRALDGTPDIAGMSIARFCSAYGYDTDFLELFLLPMGSAIWSTAPHKMRDFPIQTLIRFFLRHQFLGMHDHLQWYTVDGGAQTYVQRLIAPFRQSIRTDREVVGVSRQTGQATLRFSDGSTETFDKVVLACHADEALRLLELPSEDEARLLGKFAYETNHTLLHTDASVMPKTRRCWAAWNYKLTPGVDGGPMQASTHYWMNRLQGVSDRVNYFVSLNAQDQVAPEHILKEIIYHHPLYTLDAIAAQPELPSLNHVSADQGVYFCGSYFNYGFHEDALTAGLDAARAILEHGTR